MHIYRLYLPHTDGWKLVAISSQFNHIILYYVLCILLYITSKYSMLIRDYSVLVNKFFFLESTEFFINRNATSHSLERIKLTFAGTIFNFKISGKLFLFTFFCSLCTSNLTKWSRLWKCVCGGSKNRVIYKMGLRYLSRARPLCRIIVNFSTL